jgi:type II secretory pathway pseudopilin PulG
MMYLKTRHGQQNSFPAVGLRSSVFGLRSFRAGFTLIELLVAMALTMFIMIILSQAFATGVDVFSQLKAVGDMEENLRAATTSLRSDLAADHFEGRRRLSDPDILSSRPKEGFFRIGGATTTIAEGSSGGVASSRTTTRVLHMTVKRRGNQRQDFFSASVPAGSPLLDPTNKTTFFQQPPDVRLQDNALTYTSQWAEVAYFLVQTGTTVTPNQVGTGGTPLFALYRVERVVVPDNTYLNWPTVPPLQGNPPLLVNVANNQAAYAQLSWQSVADVAGVKMMFRTPNELTVRNNRSFYFGTKGIVAVPAGFTLDSTTTDGKNNLLGEGGRGASLVIGNVVSFQVRVLRSSKPKPSNLTRNYAATYANINYDTGVTAPIPDVDPENPALQLISAVAVTLRVWDQKTQQARQITLMQDM